MCRSRNRPPIRRTGPHCGLIGGWVLLLCCAFSTEAAADSSPSRFEQVGTITRTDTCMVWNGIPLRGPIRLLVYERTGWLWLEPSEPVVVEGQTFARVPAWLRDPAEDGPRPNLDSLVRVRRTPGAPSTLERVELENWARVTYQRLRATGLDSLSLRDTIIAGLQASGIVDSLRLDGHAASVRYVNVPWWDTCYLLNPPIPTTIPPPIPEREYAKMRSAASVRRARELEHVVGKLGSIGVLYARSGTYYIPGSIRAPLIDALVSRKNKTPRKMTLSDRERLLDSEVLRPMSREFTDEVRKAVLDAE